VGVFQVSTRVCRDGRVPARGGAYHGQAMSLYTVMVTEGRTGAAADAAAILSEI